MRTAVSVSFICGFYALLELAVLTILGLGFGCF